MVTPMEALITKRRISAVAVLLIAAVTLVFTGMALENTASGTWVSPCEVEYALYPFEIAQVGDILYLSSERNSTIYLFQSSDGCTWSEVEPTMFGEDESVWRHTALLFAAPSDNLGMAWSEFDEEKEPRCTVLWSSFNGSIWSEPEILVQSEEHCDLRDVMVLEDGAVLLLWNEDLVHDVKDGDRTFEFSGCDVVYRAYISNEELLIERVIEPEDTRFCNADGYSFVDDGQHIWCVFEYGLYGETPTIYRSGSTDGKQWSPPEPVQIFDLNSRRIFLTPQGEIGVLDFDVGKRDLFLLTSPDWKKWSREKLFRAENGIRGAMATVGPDMMWGFLHTEGIEDELFFIHSDKGSTDYEERMFVVKILDRLSVGCIILLVLLPIYWIWNLKKNRQSHNS